MRRVPWVMRGLWMLVSPLLVYLILTDLVFLAWGISGREVDEHSELFLTGIGAAVAFFPLMFWYQSWCRSRRGGEDRRQEGKTRLAIRAVVLGAGCCLFFNGVIYLLPLPSQGYRQVSRVLYQPSLGMQLLCMGLMIPAGEELVFRGLGYGRIRKEIPAREAILLSALWFGLYHGNLPQGIYAGLLGIFAAVFYESSGCLWACWLFHGAANVTAVAATRFISGEGFLTSAGWMPGAVVLGGGLVFLSGRKDIRRICNMIRRDGERT